MNVYFCCTSGISIAKSVNFLFDQIRHSSFTAPFGTMRAIFILISNPLFRLSRPSRFVLPFWFSHCFLLNRHKNPIYTRLFLQRRVVFLYILDFKTVETIKKSAQFQFLLQNGYKIAQVIFFFNAKEYKLFGGNVRFSAV